MATKRSTSFNLFLQTPVNILGEGSPNFSRNPAVTRIFVSSRRVVTTSMFPAFSGSRPPRRGMQSHDADMFMREGITASAGTYVYLDGKHSHDYVACDAIPFGSASEPVSIRDVFRSQA